MAAETQQTGLTADERSDIRSTVLDTRELIEDDLYRQLERYGVYEDERVDLEQLGHLDAYDRQTRRTIDAALDREMEATEGDYQRSLKNYVREATKTYLNRLVALKAIEVRGLVTETLLERPEYGNRSEMLRTVDEVAGELTDQQDGGQSAALELVYTELTDEIGVIFEESEHTAIDLDFAVREEVIEQLNEIDESVWESDEAMGWVYQYFGEKEREEIDDRIDEENYKVQDTDVATKTQLFTPRYIVEWMVDNSLGRLWMEMHGEETNIDDEDSCFYLAPLEESLIDRDVKNVRDINVLDPACGSGHMLFYAFDVLYEMYLEEGNVAEKYIPREILKHNLYGIDIDPGAAQLAALSLYVKAKNEEPDVEIEQINVVPADVVLINGEKKKEVLQGLVEPDRSILEEVWESFEDIREYGSLVRIEEKIDEILEEYEEETGHEFASGQTRITERGLEGQSSLDATKEENEWPSVKNKIKNRIAKLAEEALEENNPVEEMFAGEVEKSVRLIDLFLYDYDVVVTNPPYLGSGKMEDNLKQFVKNNYIGSRDLYTAFIERCGEFSGQGGYATLVTPEKYMFLYSYRKLRAELLSNKQFIEGAHLSGHSFSMKDRPFTIPFVLRNSDPSESSKSRFYRLTHEQEEYANHKDTIQGLDTITETLRMQKDHNDIYVVNQNDFKEIGRTPILYWLGSEVLELFSDFPSLEEVSDVKAGLCTGDDDRFVRKWWEPREKNLSEIYVKYQKSGLTRPYYDYPDDLVRWPEDQEAMENAKGGRVQNTDYYFKEGVTFKGFGKYFTVRQKPSDTIFFHKSYFVHSEEYKPRSFNGYMNSSLCRFIMNALNPGVNFEAGDGKRLPIYPKIKKNGNIMKLAEIGTESARELSKTNEVSMDFSPDHFEQVIEGGIKNILYKDSIMNSNINVAHGIIDNILFEDLGLSDISIERIYENLPKNLADFPHIANVGDLNKGNQYLHKEIPSEQLSPEEYDQLVSKVSERSSDDLREIAEDLKISPYTVAMIRHSNDLYSGDEREEAAGRLISYILGCIMGRWDIKGYSPVNDGILPVNSGFDNDVESQIRECIGIFFENVYETESEIESLLGRELNEWLQNRFFRYHHCKEYRRRGQRIPIYWHLESNDGAFSCFLYYHALDSDTFAKLRGQYIDEKLDTLQNRLEAVKSELEATDNKQAQDLRSEKEDIETKIDDITEFRDRVDDLIEEGFEPEFEAGIWKNIQKVDKHNLLAVPLDKL